MKLSTRGRYGTKALVDLVLHGDEKPVLLKDIARRQKIPLPYLEHLITPLIVGEIVKSTRGPQGGISLLKHPQDIKLSEVIQLLEGSIAPAECVNNPKVCPRSAFCVTRDIWCEMEKAMNGVLESTTLQSLAKRQKTKTDLKTLRSHKKRGKGSDANATDHMLTKRDSRTRKR